MTAPATDFTIGTEVACSDGVCGELTRVVVDPIARALTHLVVEPKHRRHRGRLVPIDLVEATGNDIRLRCSLSDFEALGPAEETHFIAPAGHTGYGYGDGQVLLLPYFVRGVGAAWLGAGPETVRVARVPVGEVEVRRGEQVHATDGTIGRVQGLIIDPSDRHVTHVLLDEGHLWGKTRVAIPISAVERVADGVWLNVDKDTVQDLPPVEFDDPTEPSGR